MPLQIGGRSLQGDYLLGRGYTGHDDEDDDASSWSPKFADYSSSSLRRSKLPEE